VLTILGSPHDKISNTRARAEDFIDEVAGAGVNLEHEVISLGRKKISPCKGCWNCTKHKPCPIKDDLPELKEKMIACDMLVLASPVYTNQVSAQMKAFFDRLFTWCHVFPLLGKYGLSVVTTGNDGHKETGSFLEKMLATYGVSSFGTVFSAGAFTSGFFPRRESARIRYKKMAGKAAKSIINGKRPRVTPWLRRMYKVMKKKMSGTHVIHFMSHGSDAGMPKPPRFLLWMFKKLLKKRNVTATQVNKVASLMVFELDWWVDRGWLTTKSFKELRSVPVPRDFNIDKRLLDNEAVLRPKRIAA
jgi:multimeric flavodoxin WrbA